MADYQADRHSGLEFEPEKKIRQIQDDLLAEHVRYAAENSPYYRSLFEKNSINSDSIRSVNDLASIPCTTKNDITGHNDDFLACKPEEIADICLTSATTGDGPSILYQNSSDLARLAYNEGAAFKMMGVNTSDTVIVCAALDRCFMAGLAYYLGGLEVGATMVRAGAGSAAQHWELIKTTGATVIVGVPSLIRKIALFALENEEDPKDAGVTILVGIGEALRDKDMKLLPVPREIENMWGAKLYSTYASTEMATAFCECPERSGGHVRPELIIVEILDDDGNAVGPGCTGEIVVTPLGVTAMPLLRFRTGDISFLINAQCKCGRNTPRLGPVIGRKNQMLKLKGTTLFPSAILAVMEEIKGIEGAFIEVGKNDDETDRVLVYAALSDDSLSTDKISERLRSKLRVVPEIILITGDELDRKTLPEGKRKRTSFFDLR